MIKLARFILSLSMIILILSACSGSIASNKDIDTLTENIGLKKETVFKNLKLEEGKNIDQLWNIVGTYAFKEERTFHGKSLTLALNFNNDTDEMYGFTYIKEFKDNGKDGYDLTKELYKDLNKEFGEPTTYPMLSKRIAVMPDYEELEPGITDYMEIWEVNDELDVELRMNVVDGNVTLVFVTYKLSGFPEV
ncbi:hypothetical protein [Bacillus niameyensis]|uniref:hypothetical protein n=1 Tax=Bacillus niameyensis TaxID=1522308 RepID=UPI0007826DD2|nr:hypothetical protein [Bacillus niameyensis]